VTRDSLRSYLLELKDGHRGERDGDALLRDVVRLLASQDEPGRRTVREQLLELVDGQDARLWGVALGSLVQEGAAETAPALEGMLRSGAHGRQWREQVVLALMRMRYAPALDVYVEHVEAGVREESPAALSLLQHLYALDRERALTLSAGYLGAHLPNEADELAGLAQGQLLSLADLDESLVSELVRRTASVNPRGGRELARMMREFLEMRFFQERLGEATATRLKERVASAAG
jgi:hypothetical protein